MTSGISDNWIGDPTGSTIGPIRNLTSHGGSGVTNLFRRFVRRECARCGHFYGQMKWNRTQTKFSNGVRIACRNDDDD